jgi:hypothetical protein
MVRERTKSRLADTISDDPMETARLVTRNKRLEQVFKLTVERCVDVCDTCSVLKPCIRWHMAAQSKAETGFFGSSDVADAIKSFKRLRGDKAGIVLVAFFVLPYWRIGKELILRV